MYFRNNLYWILLFFVGVYLPLNAQENIRGMEATVLQARLKSTQLGEKQLKIHLLDIAFNNTENFPVWLLIPAFAEDSLPANGIINARKPWAKSCISGLTYVDKQTEREDGKVKRLVKVHFIGDKQGFYAFHLPPGAKMRFDGYSIFSFKEVNTIQAVVASELLINGKLPIDQYLIYESMASKEVNILQEDTRFLNVDWEEDDLVTEAHRTEIDFIRIEKIKALTTTFK